MKHKRILFVLLFCGAAWAVFPYSLTLIVSQKDTSQEYIRNTTRVVESSVMEYFFNSGVIVSNEPIIVDGNSEEVLQKQISSAVAGGFDYVLSVSVQYAKDASSNPDAVQLRDVSSLNWKLMRSPDCRLVKDGTARPAGSAGKAAEEKVQLENIRLLCGQLGKEISAVIKKPGV